MTKYILRRLLQMLPTIFGITTISFLLVISAPGDPVTMVTFAPNNTPESIAALKRQLGLDQPARVQYAYWLVGNDYTMVDVDGDGVGDVSGIHKGILRRPRAVDSVQAPCARRSWSAFRDATDGSGAVGYAVGVPLGVSASTIAASSISSPV